MASTPAPAPGDRIFSCLDALAQRVRVGALLLGSRTPAGARDAQVIAAVAPDLPRALEPSPAAARRR